MATFWTTGQLPFTTILDIERVSESTFAVVGRRTDETVSGGVHLWDHANRTVIRSFFESPRLRFTISPVSVTAVREGLLVLSGLRDSVYEYSAAGQHTRKLALPAERLRRFAEPPSDPPPDWFQTFSVIHSGYQLADGSMLVQYFDFAPDRSALFSLLRMSSDGRRLFELAGTPQLLSVSPDGERLLFVAPESPTPNLLRVGVLRE